MEIKLNVNIGATLQVKNVKGDWDWIKPEVGCEIKLVDGEINPEALPTQFALMWDEIVGPQFASVVQELIKEQSPEVESTNETIEEDSGNTSEEFIDKLTAIMDEKTSTEEDDYY
jgi:hypothetical protein